MSILITAASSAQAYQLKSLLKTDAEVLLGDYLELPEVMLRAGRMIKTPDPQSNTFIHQMLALCLDQGIDQVFALRRAELLPLAEAAQLFAEFDITLYIPSKEELRSEIGYAATGGKIVVVKHGSVIAGDAGDLVFTSEQTGLFLGFKIFTAD